MRLENEADVAPDLDKLCVVQAGQFAPQNAEAPLLNVAEAADEREESCLTAAGGSGHDDQFPRLNGQIDPEEDLIAKLAGTEVVVQAGDLESLSIVFLRHGRTPPATSAANPWSSEHVGRRNAPEFPDHETGRDHAHEQGECENQQDSEWAQDKRYASYALVSHIEHKTHRRASRESHDREVEGFEQNDLDQVQPPVADRQQGRIFTDVRGDLAEEDLVTDHHAHDESHDHAQKEDKSDRGVPQPELFFVVDELVFRENLHRRGQGLCETGFDVVGCPRADLDQPDVDGQAFGIGTAAVGEVVKEVAVTH